MTNEEVAVKVAEMEQRAKSNTRRIEKLELQTEAVQSMAESLAVFANEQKNQTDSINRIEKNVEKLDGKVEALEKKPAKKWDKVVETIVTLLIGAIAALVFSQIGLG